MRTSRRAAALVLIAGLTAGLTGCGGEEAAPSGPTLPLGPVEIAIDDRGIAHVYAQSDEDLYFGYGYQIASDRLYQLDMFRRFALGRLSEVLGADGKGSVGANSLADDRFAKIFDWERWGRADAELMKTEAPEDYQLVSAWVAGVNARVEEVQSGAAPLPHGFGPDAYDYSPEPWSAEDVYIVQKMAGFGLDQTILFEVFVTFTELLAPDALAAIQLFRPARQTFVLPEGDMPQGETAASWTAPVDAERYACLEPAPVVAPHQQATLASLSRLSHLKPLGSNNWAVDGRHTSSGRPIIAGDPHLGYDFSGTTYAIHLNSKDAGGTFDVTGFGFVGAPGIFAGHNDRVAWTETSAFADVMDMWAVELVDGKAMIAGELVDTVEREVTIGIRDGEPDEITVVDVPGYGVIMPHTLVGSPLPIAGAGKEVLIGWTGFRARPARYFRELMRVSDLDEFEAAVDRMPEMTYNFMAADATGVSYRVGVEVPARNAPADGREPWWTMDANDPASFWPEGKFLSADQKPHSRAQERGWIASANNDPFGFTADGNIHDDPWYYGALFPPGWRAERIEDELTRLVSEGPVDVEAMQALQTDARSNLADDMLPVLTEVWAKVGSDPALSAYDNRPELAVLAQLLTVDWDRQMRRDSSGAVAFHAFAHFAAAAVIEDDLSSILFETVLEAAPMYMLKIAALAMNGVYPDGDLVMQEGRDMVVLMALSDTAAWLEQRFGGVEPSGYRYGDMRVSSMDDAYGRGIAMFDIATDGGESTVNVAQSTFREGGEVLEQWVSHWGPIERQVMTFAEDGTPVSYANSVLGNVAEPSSSHYDDGMDDWIEGRYRELLFDRAAVEAAEERHVTIPAAAR
jgi:penicillin G amidase